MSAKYRIDLFGKAGCAKCKVLGQRLDKLLEKDEWKDIEKKYYDVETEEGIITFCEAECINPQRIPAIMLKKQDETTGEYVPVINLMPGREDTVYGNSKLYQYLGLQTDYSDEGKGVISPKMITKVLEEAGAVH